MSDDPDDFGEPRDIKLLKDIADQAIKAAEFDVNDTVPARQAAKERAIRIAIEELMRQQPEADEELKQRMREVVAERIKELGLKHVTPD